MTTTKTGGFRSPMPFGWGANPNGFGSMGREGDGVDVTNAFRLGG